MSADDVVASYLAARDEPPFMFLPEAGTRQARHHRLFGRTVLPLRIPPLDGHNPETTLARGTGVLEEMRQHSGLTWWIGVGTALGFTRERGFIAGDSDLDIRIGLDFRDEAATRTLASAVVERFEREGFRLVKET